MYNEGSQHEKIDMTSNAPYYPPPENQFAPIQPPGYPQPMPQPMPYHQQPTTATHNTNTTVVIQQ